MRAKTITTNDHEFFYAFKPLGALLNPRVRYTFSRELGEIADRVLIARAAYSLYDTETKDVINFVSVVQRFEQDNGFRERMINKVEKATADIRQSHKSVIRCNRYVIEGDWDLKCDLNRIVGQVAEKWMEENRTVIEEGVLSAVHEDSFRELLKDQLRDLESIKDKLLYYTPDALGSNRYLVYFLELEEAIAVPIRRNLLGLQSGREDIVTSTQHLLSKINEGTSLFTPDWAAKASPPIDLNSYVCELAKDQVLDIFLASEAGLLKLPKTQTALNIIGSYNKAKRQLHSERNIFSATNKKVMSRVEHRWELHRRYTDIVFSGSFSKAPLLPVSRQILFKYLEEQVTDEFSDEGLQKLSTREPFDIAGSFAIQRVTSTALDDLSYYYADLISPSWRSAMASFPQIAIETLLAIIIPAIISGSVEAYIGWRLVKRLEGAKDTEPSFVNVASSSEAVSESIRVLGYACEEILRYKYYVFDAADLSGARRSAEELTANFNYLVSQSTSLEDPALTADLESLAQLFSKEAKVLARKRSKNERIQAIIGLRRSLCEELEVISVLRNRATEILQEHINARHKLYDRAESTLFELRGIAGENVERDNYLAEETSYRIVLINAPYILTLAIRHFLTDKYP